jgi:hypothetical protein
MKMILFLSEVGLQLIIPKQKQMASRIELAKALLFLPGYHFQEALLRRLAACSPKRNRKEN